jgi:hypothetical protein
MSLVDQDGRAIAPTHPAGPAIRVCVAVPSGDDVKAAFAFDLTQLVGATIGARKDIDVRLSTVQGTIIHTARRDLVRMALKGDCTHILFLDSDMRFPRNALVRLLSHGVPIVGANYVTRRPNPKPVTFASDTSDKERVYTELTSTGLQEVDSTGFGVMLIHLDVFRNLSEPWFSFEWKTPQWMVGEDVYFCRKARTELEVPTFIDHDLSQEIRHVGTYEYHMTDALVARDMAQEAQPEEAGSETVEVVN